MPHSLRTATLVPRAGRRARREGQSREVDWRPFSGAASYLWQGNILTRGYTGHEQLDPVGLVHMNGRVYDPSLGRFLSADPFIQDVTNLQALNAYSYALNNPLSFTDPSGFFFSKLFKAIGNFFKSVFRAIGNVFRAALYSQIVRAIIQIAACATIGPACAAVTVGLTLAAGGSIVEAITSAAFTFISAGVWGAVGDVLQQVVNVSSFGGAIVKSVVHGVVGGALSVAQGGTFLSGFASNALSAGAGFLTQGTSLSNNIYAGSAVAALAGGLAAEVTGGKFANGAITAAFAFMYNSCRHNTNCLNPGDDKLMPGQMTEIKDPETGKWMWVPRGAAAAVLGRPPKADPINIIFGGEFSGYSPFGGGSGSAGGFLNFGSGEAGAFMSTEGGFGSPNVSGNFFAGVIYGEANAVFGTTYNLTGSLGPFSMTRVYGANGGNIGTLFGYGRGSPVFSMSVSVANLQMKRFGPKHFANFLMLTASGIVAASFVIGQQLEEEIIVIGGVVIAGLIASGASLIKCPKCQQPVLKHRTNIFGFYLNAWRFMAPARCEKCGKDL